MAQPGGGPPPPPGEPVPITGIEILLAAGAFFGVSRFLQRKSRKTN